MSETASSRKKRVFISATTHDLKSYRKAVTEWAKEQNYEPIVQDEFPTHSDYYTVRTLLRDKISLCDAVIHLAGLYYGAEPEGNNSPETRRSYTQLEYDVSRALRKQIITLIASEKYKPDNSIEDQSDQLAQLQSEHRARIKTNKDIYHSFEDITELKDKLAHVVITDTIAKPNNLPAVGSLFKGRDELLEQLRAKVESKVGSKLVIATKQTIHGLGGIGKTRLAIEYANRYSEHYNALLFIAADSPQSLKANIANLCGALGIYEPEPVKQYRAAINWLQEHPGWLLILDNVNTDEAATAVEESILKLKEGHVIVTSRLSKWVNLVEDLDAIQLDVISEKASVDLLLEGTLNRRTVNPSEKDDVKSLAKRLGYLPLALRQAIGFIVATRCSFAKYVERWDKSDKKVIEWNDKRELKYPESIATAWELSFGELGADSKALLQIISWLAPDPIPRSLIEKIPQKTVTIDIEFGVAELEKHSFLNWVDDSSEFVQVHSLVSEITRYRLSDQDHMETIEKAVAMMNAYLEDRDPSDHRNWSAIFKPTRTHIGQLIASASKTRCENSTSGLMEKLAVYLYGIAQFDDAELVFMRALVIQEKYYGLEHPVVGRLLSNFARLLKETNRLCQAELLFRRALRISESSFGPNHPNVAAVLNNLASLLGETNRHVEAVTLYWRAVDISKAAFGPDHPEVAIGMNNLAGLLMQINRHAEAEPLLRRALAINVAFYGPNHPNVGSNESNLACLLMKTNRHWESEALFRHALMITEESYGHDHPNVATHLNNLGDLLQNINRKSEAEGFFRRALVIYEQSFGANHPSVALVLNNLGNLLHLTNRLREAEDLMSRVISIDTATFGHSHPNVARDINNLAGLLQTINRLSEAEALFKKAQAIFEASYGPAHPDVALCLNNIASLLHQSKRYDESEPLYRRALAINEVSFNHDHPNVANDLNNLAGLLKETNRPIESEKLFRRALAIFEASYGLEHRNVAGVLTNLAGLLQQAGRQNEAESLYQRALKIFETSYGPGHPNVAKVLSNLACVLNETNRRREAEPLLRRALAIFEASYGPEHPTVAIVLINLACLLQETNRHNESVPLLRRALVIREASLGSDHSNTMAVRNILTHVLNLIEHKKDFP